MKIFNGHKINQQGMSTLVVSIALLIMTTMAVIFSANVGIMEKKITANDYRASQALMSAQAGIDLALANISKYGLATPVAPYMQSGNFIITNGDQPITYDDGTTTKTTGYYNISIDTTLANFPDKVTIVSEGKSVDLSASTKITQHFAFASAIRDPGTNKFLDTAVVIVNGNAEVTETRINNVDGGNSLPQKVWASNQINGSLNSTDTGLIANSGNITYGGVPPLSRLFIGSMRDPGNTGTINDKGVKYMSVRTKCTSACTNPTALQDTSNNKPQSKMHYLEGDVTIKNLTIGSTSYPVILVVDLTSGGSFSLQNSTINGVLLVKGNWDNASKSSTINGSIVVESGDLLGGDKLNVNYSKSVFDNLAQVGSYTRIPGSWSDIN